MSLFHAHGTENGDREQASLRSAKSNVSWENQHLGMTKKALYTMDYNGGLRQFGAVCVSGGGVTLFFFVCW